MSNQVTKQAVVKPGGSIDPNKTTEVLQLFDESGDPIALDGSGGGGGTAIPNVIFAYGALPSDAPASSASYAGFPDGTYLFADVYCTNLTAGVYKTNGTNDLVPVITGTLTAPLILICSKSAETWTDFISSPTGFHVMFFVNAGWNFETDDASNGNSFVLDDLH